MNPEVLKALMQSLGMTQNGPMLPDPPTPPAPMAQDATAVAEKRPVLWELLDEPENRRRSGMMAELSDEDLMGLEEDINKQFFDMRTIAENPERNNLERGLASIRSDVLRERRRRMGELKGETASDGRPILEHLLAGTKPPNR